MPRRGFSTVYRRTSGLSRRTRTATARPVSPAKRSSTSSRCRARRPVFLISSEHSNGSPAVARTGARLTTSMPRTFHHGSGTATATTPPIPAATTYSQPAPEFVAIRYRIMPRQTTNAGFTILLKPRRLIYMLRGRRHRLEDLADHCLRRRPGHPAAHREPVRQGLRRQLLDVLRSREVAPARRRARLGRSDEDDGRAGRDP